MLNRLIRWVLPESVVADIAREYLDYQEARGFVMCREVRYGVNGNLKRYVRIR